jgi:hypothetical protein
MSIKPTLNTTLVRQDNRQPRVDLINTGHLELKRELTLEMS